MNDVNYSFWHGLWTMAIMWVATLAIVCYKIGDLEYAGYFCILDAFVLIMAVYMGKKARDKRCYYVSDSVHDDQTKVSPGYGDFIKKLR